MNIIMCGIDHTMADVSIRECYALSKSEQRDILEAAKKNADILGIVILSTCNRTEIYVSLREGVGIDPFRLFLSGITAEKECRSLCDKDAYLHLALLACGAHSRIFGEEQILTQVKSAVALSREKKATDNLLEVFFRTAISAAKRVKTSVRFPRAGASAARAVRGILDRQNAGSRVLVIGNGEVGQQAAGELAQGGYHVTMTRRQYRHSDVKVPKGVEIIDYDRRYEVMEDYDTVVSATSSPHYTVLAQKLTRCGMFPRLYIDLALPRDIDPDVGKIEGATLLDIDQVADSTERESVREQLMSQIMPTLEQSYEELLRWESGAVRNLEQASKTHFPLFIDSTGKSVLVVGGGAIAARRVGVLSQFSFLIHVVAPMIRDEILALEHEGRISCDIRNFEDSDLDGVFMVIAATDDREVNHKIAVLAKHRDIYASIADKRDECSFYFPAIAANDEVTAGICGDGVAHRAASQAAKKVREVLNETHNNRQP